MPRGYVLKPTCRPFWVTREAPILAASPRQVLRLRAGRSLSQGARGLDIALRRAPQSAKAVPRGSSWMPSDNAARPAALYGMAAESAAGIDARVSRLLPVAAAGPCAWVCFPSARPRVRAPFLRSWTRLAALAERQG